MPAARPAALARGEAGGAAKNGAILLASCFPVANWLTSMSKSVILEVITIHIYNGNNGFFLDASSAVRLVCLGGISSTNSTAACVGDGNLQWLQ